MNIISINPVDSLDPSSSLCEDCGHPLCEHREFKRRDGTIFDICRSCNERANGFGCLKLQLLMKSSVPHALSIRYMIYDVWVDEEEDDDD